MVFTSSDQIDKNAAHLTTKYPYDIFNRAIFTNHEFDAVLHPTCKNVNVISEFGNLDVSAVGGDEFIYEVSFVGY